VRSRVKSLKFPLVIRMRLVMMLLLALSGTLLSLLLGAPVAKRLGEGIFRGQDEALDASPDQRGPPGTIVCAR
jgi:hypothetical protein